MLWGPESGLKTAHFTFLPFYLFTWGSSEVQNQASRRLILPFYLFTFLPGGPLRSRIRPQDGSFYLFTFLPFYLGVLWGPESGLKTAQFTFLPFYLFTWGVDGRVRIRAFGTFSQLIHSIYWIKWQFLYLCELILPNHLKNLAYN